MMWSATRRSVAMKLMRTVTANAKAAGMSAIPSSRAGVLTDALHASLDVERDALEGAAQRSRERDAQDDREVIGRSVSPDTRTIGLF